MNFSSGLSSFFFFHQLNFGPHIPSVFPWCGSCSISVRNDVPSCSRSTNRDDVPITGTWPISRSQAAKLRLTQDPWSDLAPAIGLECYFALCFILASRCFYWKTQIEYLQFIRLYEFIWSFKSLQLHLPVQVSPDHMLCVPVLALQGHSCGSELLQRRPGLKNALLHSCVSARTWIDFQTFLVLLKFVRPSLFYNNVTLSNTISAHHNCAKGAINNSNTKINNMNAQDVWCHTLYISIWYTHR